MGGAEKVIQNGGSQKLSTQQSHKELENQRSLLTWLHLHIFLEIQNPHSAWMFWLATDNLIGWNKFLDNLTGKVWKGKKITWEMKQEKCMKPYVLFCCNHKVVLFYRLSLAVAKRTWITVYKRKFFHGLGLLFRHEQPIPRYDHRYSRCENIKKPKAYLDLQCVYFTFVNSSKENGWKNSCRYIILIAM